MVPHDPLMQISTLPSLDTDPPINRTSPYVQFTISLTGI